MSAQYFFGNFVTNLNKSTITYQLNQGTILLAIDHTDDAGTYWIWLHCHLDILRHHASMVLTKGVT